MLSWGRLLRRQARRKDAQLNIFEHSTLIVAYQRQCREHGDALVDLYIASGLFTEILKPMPLLRHREAVEV